MRDFSDLSGLQIDALREIGNIGAGNAATALATMVRDKINMTVPQVSIVPFDDVAQMVGGPDSLVVAIYLRVHGSAGANIMFIMPLEKAFLLIDMLMGRPLGETRELGEMECSAITELGNIITGNYLNALAVFTNLTLIPSVPAMGVDMAGALIDAVLAILGEVEDYVLLLETEFKKSDLDVMGHFFLLPEPGGLDTILSALGVNY